MEIKKDYALKKHNTFGIDVQTDWFITYHNVEDLDTLSIDEYFQECKVIHIGEGSNLLFLSNFHGIILYSAIKDVELVYEDNTEVFLRVGSGLKWDDFVAYAVEHGYWGVENLSIIPGTVGASAVQNIGAYGMEVCNVIDRVEVINLKDGLHKTMRRDECRYAYRDSIFKYDEYKKTVIHHVVFRLKKNGSPIISYPDLHKRLGNREHLSLNDIRKEVIQIRTEKLPSVDKLGNAGSFFMNPILDKDVFIALQKEYPDVPHYPLNNGQIKVPAGWLIDKCGLKGYRKDHVGVYSKQALVIINYGGATGREIARFAEEIQEKVKQKFNVNIQPEVKYIL